MNVYVYKADIRSWQNFPAIPEERKSEFYEITTELNHDELINDYEFIVKSGACSLVRKVTSELSGETMPRQLNRDNISTAPDI